MAKALKSRASKFTYVSPSQLTLDGFDTSFSKNLDPNDRWVILAKKIPWDVLTNIYSKQLNNVSKGANGINPRVIIGSLVIKHYCDLSDRETIVAIQENIYMQYFIGYSSFSQEAPFDASLFVDIRKRLGVDQINAINEKILQLCEVLPVVDQDNEPSEKKDDDKQPCPEQKSGADNKAVEEREIKKDSSNQGALIVDATACPQDISYPTDLNLLNDAREKPEGLIDILCGKEKGITKPRTYREIARKQYLKVAQKKNKTKRGIRAANKKQLACLQRNIKSIHSLLTLFEKIPFKKNSTNTYW